MLVSLRDLRGKCGLILVIYHVGVGRQRCSFVSWSSRCVQSKGEFCFE